MRYPVLIVLHQEHSTPGRIGHAVQQLGYTLDVRRPRFGEALPATMAEHSAAIIFGGPMSANDGDDFIRREIEWVGVPLRDNKPFLGICLGAQICAKFLGGKVFRHASGQAEAGYYPVRPTAAGLAVVETWPECSINGIGRASTCRTAASCSPRAIFSKYRRSASKVPSRCNFIPRSPTR